MQSYNKISLWFLTFGLMIGVMVLAPFKSVAQSDKYMQIRRDNFQNWQRMIKKLGINLPDSLPPPAKDPNRPEGTFQKKSGGWIDSSSNTYARSPWGTWTNYDESKANPYDQLPDPLVLDNGQRVTSPKMWWGERRQEIIKHFNQQIYGRIPNNVPPVNWEVVSVEDTTIGKTKAQKKELAGHVNNSSSPDISVTIQATLITPADLQKPAPAMIHLDFHFPAGFKMPGSHKSDGPSWQEQLLKQGWGYVNYIPTSVQPDHAAGLTKGIIGLTNDGELREPWQWGALRAWAWGAGRVLDYLQTDSKVDAKKVGIEGVSRYGKAALVTMAYDQRFAIGLIGSSGKGGAALFRRNFGETNGIIGSPSEYHWFAGNFLKYAGKGQVNNLAVDSHELFALCAPRPVFVSEGSPSVEGTWVDDKGQFMAASAADPVYHLLGEKGLETHQMPPEETFINNGPLVFRQHSGGHTDGPNWPYFIDFAKKYLEK